MIAVIIIQELYIQQLYIHISILTYYANGVNPINIGIRILKNAKCLPIIAVGTFFYNSHILAHSA